VGFFEDLHSAAGRRKLDFLVVGGHAVNVSGYSRVTADVDILACREDVHSWEQLFAEMGYVPFHRADTFLQLTPPRELSAWPTDLVFVGRETFVQMLASARTVLIEGVEIRVPSVEHLVAMKLHSLKTAPTGREARDLQDVVGVLRAAGEDPASAEVRRLFERYGTMEAYEWFRKAWPVD
jgi:hypothetical protein